MRVTSSLSSGLPGDDDFARHAFAVSSRSSASRASASGPWQRKHLSERIGRMSRPYETGGRVSAMADRTAASRAKAHAIRMAVRSNHRELSPL